MDRPPTVAWLNGRLVPWHEAVLPIEDRGLQFGESIYEVFPVIAGRPCLVAEHCARMGHGAGELGLAAGLPSCDELAAITRRLIDADRVEEGLVYAQVTGGSAPRHHLAHASPSFLAYLRPHRFPRAEQVAAGIRAVTLVDERWAGRDLKTTMLLPAVLAKRAAAARGADEAILVGADGEVHEGASSSVFVVAGDRLLHPERSRHLLAGTIAPLAVRFAGELGLQVLPSRLRLDQLRRADELFVTATSRLAMPVLSLDDSPIGDGSAGPLVRELARRMRHELGLEG